MTATSTEVILLAISCGENGRNLKIVPTSCRMSTDNISVVKIVGSRSGRIFLAGNDGNVYEFVYENVESPWSVLLGSNRALKCRKINHSVSGWSLSHLLPAFLRGDKGPEDSLVDLSIDDARNLLYSTSCDGSICLYSFRRKFHGTLGPGSFPLIVRNFKILLEALKFSVDQKKKRTTHSDKLDDVQFLSVLRLFVVPITESRSSHAVVLLNNGTRIFLRVYSLRNGSGSDRIPYAFTGDIDTVPVGIEIAYIRNAPPVEMIRYVSHHMHMYFTCILDIIYGVHILFRTFCHLCTYVCMCVCFCMYVYVCMYVCTVRSVRGVLLSDLKSCKD